MNQEYMQLDKNKYIVSNEKGNIELINIKDDLDIEKILFKENQLEVLNNKYNECERNIDKLRENIVNRSILTVMEFCALIIIGIYMASMNWSLLINLFLFLSVNVSMHIISNMAFGTYKRNKKDWDLFYKDKNDLEIDILKIEKELEDLKQETEYKKEKIEVISNNCFKNITEDITKTVESKYKKKVLRK